MESTQQSQSPFILGVVPYMNAAPLVHCLHQVLPQARTLHYPPRQLAALLLDGTLDAALVPVVDVSAHPGLRMLTNIGVAANGPVQSVLIQARVILDEIRTIQMDPESSTSNRLAQIIMANHFHKSVEFISAVGRVSDPAVSLSTLHSQTAGPAVQPYLAYHSRLADAEVVIGDRALQRSGSGLWQCDLSEAWKAMTGLPFVFAVWATRLGHPHIMELARATEESLRLGQAILPFIARQQAVRLRLPSALCLDYLTKTVHYDLSEQDLLAIKTFRTYCAEIPTPSGAIA